MVTSAAHKSLAAFEASTAILELHIGRILNCVGVTQNADAGDCQMLHGRFSAFDWPKNVP